MGVNLYFVVRSLYAAIMFVLMFAIGGEFQKLQWSIRARQY